LKLKVGQLILGILILVLIIINLFLLQQNRSQRENLSKLAQTPSVSSFSPLLLSGTQSFCLTFVDPQTKKAYKPKLILLVFFSSGDCITCLQEAKLWQELDEKYHKRGFRLLYLVTSTDSIKAEEFAKAEGLDLPLAFVDSIYIREHIGIPQTPFKVLLDSTLTVVYLNGPNTEIEDQRRFKKVIERWCDLSL